ncbi:MAG: hypothetical protein P8N76_04795 [Pirellulaceae bacterium]|nr:hypothetical protein [Pirellulaceae bacterium]
MCKIPIQLLFRSLIATFIVCGAGHVHASWEFDESVVGLDPGSSYRLAFVTSQARDAASSEIEVYNSFVDSLGDNIVESDWKVIGSTASVDARDNTSTNPGLNGTGVPIFNLAGQRIADGNADLWDGSIQNSLLATVRGVEFFPPTPSAWTGTTAAGISADNHLGKSPDAMLGLMTSTDASWISDVSWNSTVSDAYALYGLSDILTISSPEPDPIPEPASVITWTLLGIVGCVGTWWNRRRKAS